MAGHTSNCRRWQPLLVATVLLTRSQQVTGLLTGPLLNQALRGKATGTPLDLSNYARLYGYDSDDELPLSIDRYGCWCNFHVEPYKMGGHGEPVDKIDELCKQLVENYVCAYEETFYANQVDSSVEVCEAWSARWEFQYDFSSGLDIGFGEAERLGCMNYNDDESHCLQI